MVQLDLQRPVSVDSVVAVIAKAVPRAARHGSRYTILIGIRSRKGIVIGRTFVVGKRLPSSRVNDSETHNRRLVRVVRVPIALEYVAPVVGHVGDIDAG